MSDQVVAGGCPDVLTLLTRRRAVVEAYLELAFAALVRGVEGGWIDQSFSPLGLHRHIDAVRRRVERQSHDAAIVGGRFLLTIDALVAETYRPEPAAAVAANGNGLEQEARS